MDKLYVEAGEYELKSMEDVQFALWENGEMINDVEWFRVIADIQAGIFSLDIKMSNLTTSNSRQIDDLSIRNGNICIAGDGLFDIYLRFINNQGNKKTISNIFGVELYWHRNKGLGTFQITQHAFIDSNVLDYGQTEEDWLKSKI